MNTRKNRAKKVRRDSYIEEDEAQGLSSGAESDDPEEVRKSRIRDCNKEFAKRMTILTTWSDYWTDYQTRDGEAYPLAKAKEIIKRQKKITCPIESCGKSFTTPGGLRYHYARCNIERCFKCIACDPPQQMHTRGDLLRHMILSHHDDLPALNDEQKNIANSYLSCESRVEKTKRDKKVSADTEPPYAAQKLIRAFCDIQKKTFTSNVFQTRPYKEWFCDEWEPITHEIQRMRYYPPESESPSFRLSTDISWSKLRVGYSAELYQDKKGQTTSVIFFTGGINTATAWLPKPPSLNCILGSDLVAIAVNCCSMEQSLSYKESQNGEGCIQFWTVGGFKSPKSQNTGYKSTNKSCLLSYIVAHEYGTVHEMLWCPLGTSWQPETESGLSRAGLLAIACGDGQIRILSVPHTKQLVAKVTSDMNIGSSLESIPIFKTKPVAILLPPGVGSSTCHQAVSCKSISWNIEDNQKLIVAGYANGSVAIFDFENSSPILYSNQDGLHIYRPLKSWIAHGGPVTGVAISTHTTDNVLIATGSVDRQLKIWNFADLSSCLSNDRAPITRILWDYRFRGIVCATDAAFTSFHNRVSYRYPVAEGNHTVTISNHRSTVWGLDNSRVTNAIATSDGAGEVFVLPQLVNRSALKRDRNFLNTHRFYSMIPKPLSDVERYVTIAESTAPENNESAGERKHQVTEENGDQEEDGLEPEVENSRIERPIANKPTKFLLPIEHRPVSTYYDFKLNYGLEFIQYDSTTTTTTGSNSYHPESCVRASDMKDIYCDRPCDYPFSSINALAWSPNIDSFQYLISSSQVGLCRLDRVHIVEQIYKGYVDSMISNNK